jgi:hypothetical protein
MSSSSSFSVLQRNRAEVFSLFRQCFRVALKMTKKTGTTTTTAVEDFARQAEYIKTESRNRFRQNRFLREQAHIQSAIDYAKMRIYMAENYGIAYERMANVASSGGGDVKIIHEGLREEVGSFQSVGLPKNVSGEEARRRAREKRRRMSESLESSSSSSSSSSSGDNSSNSSSAV